MKKIIIIYTALAICIAFISGCKDDSVTNPTDSDKPLVTLVGTPTGPADTAIIDASGGTLSSTDGMLQIIVPAGAVSSATVFSIQPITNHCPGGNATAYRLLPEGITFAQPVTVIFSYADTLTANEEYLSIAFQDTSKSWFAPIVFTIDTTENKISVQTKHFCSFATWTKLRIFPFQGTVKINGSLALEVILVGETKSIIDGYGDELVSLTDNLKFVSEWGVMSGGYGHIVYNGDNKGEYYAPTSVPTKNPFVLVWATLPNVTFRLKGETFKAPKVYANIRIIDETALLFTVEFTSSIGNDELIVDNNYFTETDEGSLSVLVQKDNVKVYNFNNVDAKVTPSAITDGECTYTVTKPGNGVFHISAVFEAMYNPLQGPDIVIVCKDAKFSEGLRPTFKKQCKKDSTRFEMLGGGRQTTQPMALYFDVSKDYQDTVLIIPASGVIKEGFIKYTFTKVK